MLGNKSLLTSLLLAGEMLSYTPKTRTRGSTTPKWKHKKQFEIKKIKARRKKNKHARVSRRLNRRYTHH